MARLRTQQVKQNALAVSIASSGVLATAAQLDANVMIVVTPTAAGVVGTLANYPNEDAFTAIVKVDPAATNNLSIYGKTVRPGQAALIIWDSINSAWTTSDVEQALQPRTIPTATGVTTDAKGNVTASTATTATVWSIPGTTAASIIDSVQVNQATLSAVSGDIVVVQVTPCTFTIPDNASVPIVGDSISAMFVA